MAEEDPKKARDDRLKAAVEKSAKAQEKTNKEMSVIQNATKVFYEAREKSDTDTKNAEMIERGKVAKSTIKQLELNGSLMSGLHNDLRIAIGNSTMNSEEQAKSLETIHEILSGSKDSTEMATAIKDVGQLLGAKLPEVVGMLTEAVKSGKKNDSKIDKLKAKEDKQDKKKTNDAAFKDAVKGVKDFGKSAFDKIKGMLIKGALILALTQVGKFLNSEAWVKIKAFIIDTLIPLLGNIWDNVLKPLFNGILDVFSIIIDLLSGDMDSALQTFKDNWMIITPLIAGVLTALAVYLFGVITTMYSVIAGGIAAMGPVLALAAPFLLIAAGIALLFYGIYKLLEMLKEKMNLSSIMDLVFIAWGYVQDGFGHLVNVYISIANLIMGLVGKFADFLGFDIEMPVLEKMKTNNAQIATERAQTNKRIADAEKAASVAKEEKQQTSAAINGGGGGGAVMANNNNTTNVNQSSTTQVMPSPMPDMTQFANYGEVQLA